ncbi:unnamed protein product [Linum trigynum]|uniref:Uncharacterized protein n=1 Tax=Linum trigynum TaxID=586398 RepID=A0AAV2CBS8_9ROSI
MVSRLYRENPVGRKMPDKLIRHIPSRERNSFNSPTSGRVKPLTELHIRPPPSPLTNNLHHQGITPLRQDPRIIAWGIYLVPRNPVRMKEGDRLAITDLPS